MHRLLMFLVIGWSTAIHAGPKEDALAAYEKFFEYFTTDNHDQLVTVFSPDVIFFGSNYRGSYKTAHLNRVRLK